MMKTFIKTTFFCFLTLSFGTSATDYINPNDSVFSSENTRSECDALHKINKEMPERKRQKISFSFELDENNDLAQAEIYREEARICACNGDYKGEAINLLKAVWCGADESLNYLWYIIEAYQENNPNSQYPFITYDDFMDHDDKKDKKYFESLYPLVVDILKYKYQKFCKNTFI